MLDVRQWAGRRIHRCLTFVELPARQLPPEATRSLAVHPAQPTIVASGGPKNKHLVGPKAA
jgi:hypothetical protein